MQKIILFTIIFTSTVAIAQRPQFVGEYGKRSETKEGTVIEYTLSLKSDGTFTFHFYRNIDPSQPKENSYGKGTWEVDKKSVSFYVDKDVDIDEKHTLNFINTKARFIQKVPRGETTANKQTYFLFYDSEIAMIKGLKLSRK